MVENRSETLVELRDEVFTDHWIKMMLAYPGALDRDEMNGLRSTLLTYLQRAQDKYAQRRRANDKVDAIFEQFGPFIALVIASNWCTGCVAESICEHVSGVSYSDIMRGFKDRGWRNDESTHAEHIEERESAKRKADRERLKAQRKAKAEQRTRQLEREAELAVKQSQEQNNQHMERTNG